MQTQMDLLSTPSTHDELLVRTDPLSQFFICGGELVAFDFLFVWSFDLRSQRRRCWQLSYWTPCWRCLFRRCSNDGALLSPSIFVSSHLCFELLWDVKFELALQNLGKCRRTRVYSMHSMTTSPLFGLCILRLPEPQPVSLPRELSPCSPVKIWSILLKSEELGLFGLGAASMF